MISNAERNDARISLARVSSFVLICAILLFGIIWAKTILVPLAFAAVFALTLRPVVMQVERLIRLRWLAILIAFLAVAIPIAGAILLFSFQTVSVLDDLPTITEEFQESVNRIFVSLTNRLDIDVQLSGSEWIQERVSDSLDEPFVYVRGLLAGGAGLVGTLLLIGLYTFLLLLYRRPIYYFVLGQFGRDTRRAMEEVFADTQRMSYTYLKGLGTVMLILGVLNSCGLMLIGIDYAFFWGFLAAFLAIIPYVGTFLGGLLPFMYALSTTDTSWQPIAVVGLFMIIQTIEGNIITPKVVGSSIKVNPLAAIVALFFAGFVWGVEGLIIALPITAILRIFLVHSGRFRPFGLLLSDDLSEREHEFLGALDQPHYRLANFFKPITRHVTRAKKRKSVTHVEDFADGRRTSVDVAITDEPETVEEAGPLG